MQSLQPIYGISESQKLDLNLTTILALACIPLILWELSIYFPGEVMLFAVVCISSQRPHDLKSRNSISS